MGQIKEITMEEFARYGREFKLKGDQYKWCDFYRFLFKNHVSLKIFMEDALPISQYFGYNSSKEHLEELYNALVKEKFQIPLGKGLFEYYAIMVSQDLLDEIYKTKEDVTAVTGERFVDIILNHYDAEPYPLVKDIIAHLDLVEFKKAMDEHINIYRNKICEVVIDLGDSTKAKDAP